MRLLRFHASWCGPCMKMKPIVAAIAYDHGLELVDIDVDDQREWAEAYGVTGVPTLVLEDEHGTVLGEHVGAKPKRIVEAALGLI